MVFSHSTRRLSFLLGSAFALLCADSVLAQRRINPVVLAPVASYALPRQAVLTNGAWAGPLEPFFDMNDWLPFLGVLGLSPVEKEMASQRIVAIPAFAWQALYERRRIREPDPRATQAVTRR